MIMTETRSPSVNDLFLKLKWLMFLRVILVTFLFGVTILISRRGPHTELVSSFRFLFYLIVYSYLLTVVSAVLFQYLKNPVWFCYFQVIGDIIFITGILDITGGIESPFVFLYLLTILSGSILRYQEGSLATALLSSAAYLILFYVNVLKQAPSHPGLLVSYGSVQLYYRVFLNLFSFFLVAFLSNHLARRLQKAREEIRLKEDSIEDLQALHENIIQSVTSGLITTDLSGRITSVNHSSETILQIPGEEIRRMELNQLFPYQEVRTCLSRLSRMQNKEGFSRFEIRYSARNGSDMILGMTLSMLLNKSGTPKGLICTFQDLTRFKALEEKIKRKEQLAMIGELSAGIAHEIRNPLASMSGSIQVLRSELDLSPENRKLMDIILKETDRLNDLIGNFLVYARPRPLRCKPESIRDLIEDAITLLKRGKHIHENIRIQTEMDEHLLVNVDSMAIRQVLWNLVTNAIEAMPEGGILRIQTRKGTSPPPFQGERPNSSMIRVSVSDTGTGIDPKIKEKIFFPFHTTKGSGSGLGLAIVHQITQQHHGWVDVVSSSGRGTVFHLYLPEAVPSAIHQE